MLLQFEIENDGAFATNSVLTLTTGRLRDVDEGHVLDVGDKGKTKALASVLILGKNGSGKSTLVNALAFVARFVKNSANESQHAEKISFDPNLLVAGCGDLQTRYCITFSMRDSIYEFEFSHDADRIWFEALSVADKTTRYRKMYERVWDPEKQNYDFSFGDALSGRKSIWQDSTRSNALFLSTAAQLNSEDIIPPYEWLTRYLRITHVGEGSSRLTAMMCEDNPRFTRQVVSFLQAMDINVDEIAIETEDRDQSFIETTFAPDFVKMLRTVPNAEEVFSKQKVVIFKKRDDQGRLVDFPLARESTGTKALFNLAGPLFDTLRNGYCLLIDEINTSLHPVIVAFLVNLFANKKHNKKRAQLVFTSHDTSVLARRRLRRDQVWFIDHFDGNSTLTPLSDFSPRRHEAIDKGYLGGRYGGIPQIAPAYLLTSDFED